MPRAGKEKRCIICGNMFVPDVYNASRQKCCSKPECQELRRNAFRTSWYKKEHRTIDECTIGKTCADCGSAFKVDKYHGYLKLCSICRDATIKARHVASERKRRVRATVRLSYNISRRIRRLMQSGIGSGGWHALVGYTLSDLMAHLESKFQRGMSWKNYGEWHMDHIKPVASFSFSSYEDGQFKQCWALDNLQPLWAADNLKKLNKVAA